MNECKHNDLYEAYKTGMDNINITPVQKETALQGFINWYATEKTMDEAGKISAIFVLKQIKGELSRMYQDIDILEKLIKGEGNVKEETK